MCGVHWNVESRLSPRIDESFSANPPPIMLEKHERVRIVFLLLALLDVGDVSSHRGLDYNWETYYCHRHNVRGKYSTYTRSMGVGYLVLLLLVLRGGL